ncbi:bidirectional sugar transporter SWEET11-like [Impatiens glandulifera]|uniref:bidirectional sugar transporter SWEET11-like n=1 Tax=Impatiens glandulifera TaxID=253017 RepID=UPI001FB08A7E|nr:bidirectional sugar transporter SWEET11-like [Impatiens glandulifera]XP_047307413.1 bidirectional sugar transporter SWEET11-like [Impatiens glandulifera]
MTYFTQVHVANIFGIFGNIISSMVFLSPVPTFYTIWTNKSTAGFQSVPYVVALFSATLLLYYGILKKHDVVLLITINSFGILIETVYISIYLYYSTTKVQTVRMLVLILVGFAAIVISSQFAIKDYSSRLQIVGRICLVFSVCVFVAPLLVVKQVIQTKNSQFMPFYLSLTLTINAIIWFIYGLLINDMNIAIPNVLGLFFGVVQMILYWIYRNGPRPNLPIVNNDVIEGDVERNVEEELGQALDE